MTLDWDTLNNLRSHKAAWIAILQRQKRLTTQDLLNTKSDDPEWDRAKAIHDETSYLDHELVVLEATLTQAAELADAVKALEPLLRLILEGD